MVTGNYNIEGVGVVHVLVKPNSRSVKARWKGERLHATVPPYITPDQLIDILKGMVPKLEQHKPDALYRIGQEIQMPDFSVSIRAQSHVPDKMLMNYRNGRGSIEVGTNWDMASHDTVIAISKMLCRLAQRIAPSILLPQAREVAQRIGRQPMLWTISNGHRVLGHCDSRGVIALSHALVFYPLHLRDYVICHELAHLSELNHSPRFHQICDTYCQGREQELIAELKAYSPPILR